MGEENILVGTFMWFS